MKQNGPTARWGRLPRLKIPAALDHFWHISDRHCITERGHMTREQEKQLEFLDAEIQIVDKQLRVAEVKKRIAQVELDTVQLHQTLELQLREEIPAVSSNITHAGATAGSLAS